jgi:hypothetical protein
MMERKEDVFILQESPSAKAAAVIFPDRTSKSWHIPMDKGKGPSMTVKRV